MMIRRQMMKMTVAATLLLTSCGPPPGAEEPFAVQADGVDDVFLGTPKPRKRRVPHEPRSEPLTQSVTCSPEGWRSGLQFGTKNDDEVLGLAADASGNFYATGYRGGLAGLRNPENIDPSGNSTAFLRKYDAAGTQIWNQAVNTAGSDSGESIVVRNDSVYWLGRTTGALPKFANKGEFDSFVQIMGKDGKPQGAVEFGDEKPQHPRSLVIDSKGNPIVAGYDDRYIVGRALRSNEVSRIVKLDSSLLVGSPSGWEYQMTDDPSAANFVFGAAVDMVTGTPGVYLAGTGYGGGYVQKLSESGLVVWERRLTTFAIDPANAIAVNRNGDLLVAGSTFLLLGGVRHGQQDVFLASIDKATGDVLWAMNAGTDASDWATAIATDASGDIYVGGETSGVLVPGYTPSGPNDQDLFVMRFASDGTLKGVWQRGAVGPDHVAAMTVDACGDLVVAGYTSGDLVGPGKHIGARDAFVLKIRATDWSAPAAIR